MKTIMLNYFLFFPEFQAETHNGKFFRVKLSEKNKKHCNPQRFL
jgi:hypothetical protein